MLKKKLAVLLFASGIFGSAYAQEGSEVSVYGVIDAGMQSYKNGTSSYSRSAENLLSTSRLGFRGSEDLGDGLKANFNLEMQVNPMSGSVGSTTVATNEIFNREAWIGLSGNFGEVRLGRTDMTLMSELDTFAGVRTSGNFSLTPINGTAVELGQDIKNTTKYISPKIEGFQLQVARASNPVGSATDVQLNQNSISLSYEIGDLKLAAARQKNKGPTKAEGRDATGVAAYYDFGKMSVGIAHLTGDVSTTGDVTSKATVLSTKVPLANNVSLFGVYAMANDGTKATEGKGKGFTIGAIKELSKRTRLYAAYTNVSNEENSSMRMNGTTAPTTPGLDPKAITIGMVRSF